MKTTIEVSDTLFKSAKALAQRRKITMRQVIEDGLRAVLREAHEQPRQAFKLADASVTGSSTTVPLASQWSRLEEEHVIARAMKPGKR